MDVTSLVSARIAMAALAVIVVVGGAAAWLQLRRDTGRADAADASQVARGRAIYAAACASCHGANLEGQPDWRTRLPNGRLPAPPHDETGHTWHHPDRVLFDITRHGVEANAPAGYRSDMPGFAGKLADDEIWAVLAYIKSRWPADIRERQARLSEQGR